MASSYTFGNHFEGFVRDMVQSGRYASASEVVRDGLRLMEEREALRLAKLDALRTSIEEGLASGASDRTFVLSRCFPAFDIQSLVYAIDCSIPTPEREIIPKVTRK